MSPCDNDLLRLTETAARALTALLGPPPGPSLRVFLSFLNESGPRLDLAPDAPSGDDETYTAHGWNFVINRQLLQQAAPLVVDYGADGFAIHSSLDFSEAGGNCGGACGSH